MENIKIKSERNYGIDLLRSIAMFMVVTLHTLSFSGLLTKTESLSAKYEVSWLLEIASYCAVNCFVIISGYVGLNSKFRISRVIGLWLQVVFYLVLADLVVQFYNMSAGAEFDMDLFISQFLPVSNKKYWFFTQYFALSFLMPFINKAVKNQSFKSCLTLSLSLFAIFSLLPTIVASPLPYIGTKPAMDLFFLGKGYSVIWSAVLYVSGCTVKKLKEEGKIKIKCYVSLLIYAACVLAVWGI